MQVVGEFWVVISGEINVDPFTFNFIIIILIRKYKNVEQAIVYSFKKKWYGQKLSHQNNVREPYRKITHSRVILFRINGRCTDTASNVQQKGSWDGDVPGWVADRERERDTDIIVSRRKCDAMIGVRGGYRVCVLCRLLFLFFSFFSPFEGGN